MQQNSSWGNWSRQVVPANHFKGPFSHQQTQNSDSTPISANCSFLQVPLQPKMTGTSYVLLNISGNTNFVHFKILFERRALSLINKFTKFSNGRSTSLLRNLLKYFPFPQCHSYLNRKQLFCKFSCFISLKQRVKNLRRPWQEEMIKCQSLVCTGSPRTFSSSGSAQSSAAPLGTSPAAAGLLQHTPGVPLPPAAPFSFLPCLTLLCRAAGSLPHTWRIFDVRSCSLRFPSLPSSSRSCPQLPEGPCQDITDWAQQSHTQRLGEFSSGQCCHIHQWGTSKAKVTGDKHDLNFSSQVFVPPVKSTVKDNGGLKRTFWK